MPIFTSIILLFGILHVFYGRAKYFVCQQFVITEENVARVDSRHLIMVQSFITTFNYKDGDLEVKKTILQNLKTIETYYKTFNATTSFEALKVMPCLIQMLGRDYPTDMKSVWIGAAIFIDIIGEIELSKMKKITFSEINDLLVKFRDDCAVYCLEGIKDRSFFELFQNTRLQEKMLALFLTMAGTLQAPSLAHYLIQSDLNRDQLKLALNIIKRNRYKFGHEVFARVVAERARNYLLSRDSVDSVKLLTLYHFVNDHELISKTESLILDKVLQ